MEATTTEESSSINSTLESCIAAAGGSVALAYALGVQPETIRNWRTTGRVRNIPAAVLLGQWFGVDAEDLTRCAVANPDGLAPNRVRKAAKEARARARSKENQ